MNKSQHNDIKTVTIMKYLGSDEEYHFIVLDKFDIADEVKRLDYMNNLKNKMLEIGEMKKTSVDKVNCIILVNIKPPIQSYPQ